MAGLTANPERGKRRAVDHDLPLIPFIDFLLCLIAFLLVTAVWSQQARLTADANVPGTADSTPPEPRLALHVSATDTEFILRWKRGSAVVDSTRLARQPTELDDGTVRYPELAKTVAEQWQAHGAHRGAADSAQDRAVLHTPNTTEFSEVTAMLDALHAPTREFRHGSTSIRVPAFAVAFAAE